MTAATSKCIYTIGHSNHTFEAFLALLRRHGIEAVADVRSSPYGRLEHFWREGLSAELAKHGIRYVFLGKELGARREEAEVYVDGQARYERIAKLPAFQEGLMRLVRGAEQFNIAVLCAEKDPIECHRTILVARELAAQVPLKHILADGTLEAHEHVEERLLKLMDVAPTLFEPELTRRDLVERAYALRAREIAFRATEAEE